MGGIDRVFVTEDATIEPMIAWLRLSYQDAAISGMVLQYKGFDGLWKCLLNRKWRLMSCCVGGLLTERVCVCVIR